MDPIIDEEVDEEIGDELPPMPSRPLPAVAGYELLAELGRGGMGVVYRARHLRLGRTVALKLLRGGAAAGPNERERFLREARAGAALHHPNIVQVFDVGEHVGAPYLAMELVDGSSLSERLAEGPMPARQSASLIETLARAVEHAHQNGVVHRDLKPANILLERTANGEFKTDIARSRNLANPDLPSSVLPTSASDIPKIADFGLARLVADDAGGTMSGTILGTPAYMAPEQAAGKSTTIGPAVDVYALGAILYQCLTGRPPFHTASTLETLHQIETVEPVPPSRLQPTTPHDLSTICLTCLSKEPRRRYGSASALADDLHRFLEGRPILARPVGAWERTWRWCRRNPRVAVLLGALAAVIVGGFVGVFTQWQRAERLYTVADSERNTAVANLKRYQQAADDFADLVDFIDTDQLLNIRAAPLRQELLVPALERNRQFRALYLADPARHDEVVRSQLRIAVLMRLLAQNTNRGLYNEALSEGQKALAELEAYSGDRPNVVQYRRDRAALTQNIGFCMHALNRSSEALPIMESARRMRQELLDSQPDHLDYRSELASTWNDIGLILVRMNQLERSLQALEQSVKHQKEVVDAAPHVARYRRFLCNHYFNSAMTLCDLKRSDDAAAAIKKCQDTLPYDPEQHFRAARIHARLMSVADADHHTAEAIAALRLAVKHGYRDVGGLRDNSLLGRLGQRTEFQSFVNELERRLSSADRQ